MTLKRRYAFIASTVVMSVALGGLLVYGIAQRASGVAPEVPPELRYVPGDAAVVSYIDVQGVMSSELRREMMPTLDVGSFTERQLMNDGIDFEKQVDHVVTYVEPSPPSDAPGNPPQAPRAMMLVQGTFDQGRIEQFMRDKGGVIETYNGHHISVRKEGAEEIAVGFMRPDLLAVGQANLVRRALDLPGNAPDVTSNGELMSLIRGAAGSTVWIVGYFDAVSRSLRLPASLSGRVPSVRLLSAKANVNGGVTASIRAETSSEAAAEQLREAVRGFLVLARLQGGSPSQFESALKSIELSGTDKTVQVSLAIPVETLRVLASRAREMKADPGPPR